MSGIIKSFSYMLAPYIKAENPDIKINDAIKQSCELMDGKKGFAFVLILFFMFFNKKFALSFGITYGISIGINYLLKFLINRPRPYLVDPEILNILQGGGAAMPSGHTLSATIIACFCLFLIFSRTKKTWIKIVSTFVFSAFVGLTMLSRMYLGQHYLTDTLAGLAIGIIFSLVGILVYKKISKLKKEKNNGNCN